MNETRLYGETSNATGREPPGFSEAVITAEAASCRCVTDGAYQGYML